MRANCGVRQRRSRRQSQIWKVFTRSKSLFALTTIWLLACSAVAFANAQAVSPNRVKSGAKSGSGQGKQAFASTCGGCHGLDGTGGPRAPNIADRPNVQRLSDAQISHIIENGIPGSGMPAFRTLTAAQRQSIVAYLRTLQGEKQTTSLPGDSARGKAVFFGKAGCSGCHTVAGNGGFIAGDLSEFAHVHDVEEIRSAIIDPSKNRGVQVSLVTATTRSGEKLAGRVRNEDNFSLQLQTMDGTFHFLEKSDIENLESSSQPLMPSNYRSTLSSQELNDVVSYLMSAAGVNASTPAAKKRDELED
jgi:cytochrome c oxidase cbb3-type subunit 3